MIEPDSYCREIEAYLCRKNEGHLIRIVGPAFDLVSGWAGSGIPLKVAYAGIDRYFERYYRRGPRRRPVRVEFCAPDVLDAFDDWRRSVGVRAADDARAPGEAGGADPTAAARSPARRGPSLATHIEQVLARLTLLRGATAGPRLSDDVVEQVVRRLDALQPRAKASRGEARETVIAALADAERLVLAAASDSLTADERARLRSEAEQELAPFRARMPPDAFARASAAALARLTREHFLLPHIGYE